MTEDDHQPPVTAAAMHSITVFHVLLSIKCSLQWDLTQRLVCGDVALKPNDDLLTWLAEALQGLGWPCMGLRGLPGLLAKSE